MTRFDRIATIAQAAASDLAGRTLTPTEARSVDHAVHDGGEALAGNLAEMLGLPEDEVEDHLASYDWA